MPIFLKKKKKSSDYIPGSRWRKALAKKQRFSLEELEPRYLLDANLYDPADGAGSGNGAVAANIQGNLVSTFNELAQLGDAITANPLFAGNATDKTGVISLFQKTVNEMLGYGAGDFLKGSTVPGTSIYGQRVDNYFGMDSTPTADELATYLTSNVKNVFGANSVSVSASGSTASQLKLDFNINPGGVDRNLVFGDESQEFATTFGSNAKISFDTGAMTFSVLVDLSGMDVTNASPSSENSSDKSKYWVAFGGADQGSYAVGGASSHTTTTNQLGEFGLGFGLIQAGNSTTAAGGYVQAGTSTFSLNLNLITTIDNGSDNIFTLAEMEAVSDWSSKISVTAPTAQNNVELFAPVKVSNPSGSAFISGLDGLSGSFRFKDTNLFDTRAPIVTASDPTLASLSRMTTDDLLQYLKNVAYTLGQTATQEEMESLLPFLNVSLGDAYSFEEAIQAALVKPMTFVENVITAKNAPATSSNPLNFSGDSSFKIYIIQNGAYLANGTTVTLSTDSNRDTLGELATALTTALSGVAGGVIKARVTGTASPRLELYAADGIDFYLGSVNPGSQTLNLGFEKYGIVYARNTGTITGTGAAKYQLPGVSVASASAVALSTITSPLVFTVKVGSGAVKTVTVPAGNYISVASFASAVQTAVAAAGLYNTVSGVGVRVQAAVVGSGYGVTFSETTGASLTLAGTNVSFFNLPSLTGTSLTSSSVIVLTTFNAAAAISFTVKKQSGGTLATSTATATIPAGNYANNAALVDAWKTALQAAGLLNALGDSGILVRATTVGGGAGIEFYGSADVYEMTVSGSGLAKVGMTATTVTAPWIDINVSSNGGSPVTTRVYVNGNTTKAYFSQAVNTSVSDLVDDMHAALIRAGLLSADLTSGVDFRALSNSAGNLSDTIEFFARNPGTGTGYIQAISTGSQSSSFSNLNIGSKTSENYGYSSASEKPAFHSIQEFVSMLRSAVGVPLVKLTVLSDTASVQSLKFTGWTGNVTGVTIGGGALSKLNISSGNGTTSITTGDIDLSAFDVSSSSARTLTFDVKVLSNNSVTATDFTTKTLSIVVPKKVYASARELSDTIFDLLRTTGAGLFGGLLETTPTYSAGNLASGVSPSFNFPLRMFVDADFDGEALQDLDDIELRFGSSYGSTATGRISDLSSDALQTVSRSNDLRFTLGLDLIQPSTEAEVLKAELPVIIPDWDGVLEYDSKFQIMLDDGIVYTLSVTVAETAGNESINDFVDILQDKIDAISGLSSKISVAVDELNQFDRDLIVFSTAAGVSRSLMVTVPEYLSDEALFSNASIAKLGFKTNSAPTAPVELYSYAGLDNATVPVTGSTQPFTATTGYKLASDMYVQLVLPSGVTTIFRVAASTTSTNSTLADLLSDINAASGSLNIEAVDSGGNLAFKLDTPGTGTAVFQVKLGKNAYLGAGTNPIIADTAVDSTGGYVLSTDAFFMVQLPDGTLAPFQVQKADTVGNLSLADLVEDINNAIKDNPSLTDSFYAKVVAYVDATAGDNKIRFRLNDLFFPAGGDWNLEVVTQYSELHTNGASFNLGMPAFVSSESQLAVQGPISGILNSSTGYNLSNAFSFDVSINGSAYANINVSAASFSSIGALLTAINAKLNSTNITVGTTTYKVGDFVKATTFAEGTRIQLILRDDLAATLPDILNARFAPAGSSANGYTDLGFSNQELRIGIRGSDAKLSNIFLKGRAEVLNSNFAGTASFGFVDFNFGSSDFDEVIDTQLEISGVTRVQDLMRAFGSYRNEYSGLDLDLTYDDSTAARLQLNTLTFPKDPATNLAVTGLNFGTTPYVVIEYKPKGAAASSSIGTTSTNGLDNLPEASLLFSGTNGMELLSRMGFDDVVNSLWRVGDFISDWMNNDPNGPFKTKLFFANSGLVDIYDFGQQFNKVIDQLWINPPNNLQEIQRALASGLQLNNSDVSVSIVTSGSGSTFQAALRIAFDLVRTVTETLPLYVDIAALADRSQNSGLVKQSLLGLSALSGNPTDPLEVEFSALSKLKMDLSIQLVRNNTVIEPEAVINQPSSGTFFETKFFLNGDSYTGDLPAGANRLRLGYSWINDQGQEVLAPGDVATPIAVRAASTSNLSGTYVPLSTFSTLTAAANGVLPDLDGITLVAGDTVLLKNQTNAWENGIYQVTNVGSGSAKWVLTRTTDTLQWLKVGINAGALNSGLTFMIKDLPDVVAKAATTTGLGGTYTVQSDPNLPLLTLANGALMIDNVVMVAGDYVLLKNQSPGTQNGLYQVIDAGSTGTPAKLIQLQLGEATRGKIRISGGATNGGQTFYIQNNTVTLKGASEQDKLEVVQLRTAAVAVNATGEVAQPDVYGTPQAYDEDEVLSAATLTPNVTVRVATTGTLASSTFDDSSGKITASSTNTSLVVDGRTLVLDDLVLVNHQTDPSENGVYKVTRVGAPGQSWQLTRDTSANSLSEIATLRVAVTEGTYVGMEFKQTAVVAILNESGVRFSRLINPAVFRLNLSVSPDSNGNLQAVGSTAAAAANVLRATTMRLQVGTSSTSVLNAAANGTLVVDGLTLAVNNRVLVTQQADRSQNGVYVVTNAGSASTKWILTRATDFDTAGELDGARVNVTGGTYSGKVFQQINPSVSTLGAFKVDFALMGTTATLAPYQSKTLAYYVVAATTSAINTDPANTSRTADYDNTAKTLTAKNNGSLNSLSTSSWDKVENTAITTTGIDGVTNLLVGDRILIKDQGRTGSDPAGSYQGNYQNGIYEVVSLGSSTSKWVLKRVDFADDVSEFKELRVSVIFGSNNGDTRFIQTNKNFSGFSAGENIVFSDQVSDVYGLYDVNGTLVHAWTDFSATGQVVASLPLSIVMVPSSGGETVLTKNLGSLTDTEKKALGQLGSGIINNDLYQSMPDLPPLRITIPNDTSALDGTGFVGSGLEKYFGTSLIASYFNPLPDLFRSVPPSDVLSLLRDWAFMGDALDLALFNLQFAMDQALGISVPLLGSKLADYTGFIEAFRDELTTQMRDRLRNDPLKPINAIRDSLFAALGPNGVGYLSSINDIGISVVGQTWDISDLNNSTYYGTTPEGLKFEKISGSAVEFSFAINKAMDTDATAVSIDSIDIGDSTLGLTLSSAAVVKNAANVLHDTVGGVLLRRSFEMHFGFGMDITDGFYIFNPTQASKSAAPTSDMVKVGIQAELDGDINTAGLQQYNQSGYYSQLNQLSIKVSDARKDYADDGKASGYFGTYAFNLNVTPGNIQNRVGNNDRGASVDQLRRNDVLGPATNQNALLNFTMNGDADIHLQIESLRNDLIPSYQANIFIGQRFGSGSSTLTFNGDLVGLGDATLGNKIIAQDTSLSEEDLGKVSPDWRGIRSRLTSDGREGKIVIAFQDITINVSDYLGGPLYDTLTWLNKTIEPLRPFIKFMTTPLPGTSWMPQPFILGTLLGSPFTVFVGVINALDKLLGQLVPYAAFTQRPGANPRVGIGGTYTGFFFAKDLGFFKDGNKERFDKYRTERRERDLNQSLKEAGLDKIGQDEDDDPPADKRNRFEKFADSVKEKATTPNNFSKKFDNFRDGGGVFANDSSAKGLGGDAKNYFKKLAREALAQNDDRGGKKQVLAGITGGGFQLDALRADTAIKIMLGKNADLLRVEIPQIFLGFSYTRFFPLPAFPPVGLTVGLTVKVFIQLNFGYDTTGFYWTNRNSSAQTIEASAKKPVFGFSANFSVGVALNLGFVEVGIKAFFEVGVEFFWNTPTNSEKIRQSELAWLNDNGLSLFDVRLYGKVGVTIYVDLTIPLPLFGPITIRLFDLTYEAYIFDKLIDVRSGTMQLATQTGDVLRLNTGLYAADRLFLDTNNKNEVFYVYGIGTNAGGGEDVIVAYVASGKTYFSRYNNVKHVIGYAGAGQTVISAGESTTVTGITLETGGSTYTGTLSPLQLATVNFFGGSGNSVLKAGASYNASWGRSSLQGGSGTAQLDASSLIIGLDLIAARGNTTILGSTGADKIVSNAGSDTLRGNGGGDTFYFSSDFGRDRIYVTGTGNTVNFGGASLSGYSGLSDYVVNASSVGAKFQSGPLVQSVKRGLDTVYFAVDPSGADSIDTWIGTPGADIFNVFYFAPGKTVTFNGGAGDNFYNVFLGDPKKVYNKDANANKGNIVINDTTTGSNSRLLLTQTFADTISYNSTSVTNGRELMTLSGLERIDLDAGDSTLIWGNAASPSTPQNIVGGNINTGRIIMVGNVNLTGANDIVLNLSKTLEIAYNLVVQNADSADSRNITIKVQNTNPLLTSDIYIGAGAGIFLAQGTGTTGNGYGVITLYAPTGSIANTPSETGGIIRADNGYLEMRARDSIGASGDSLQVRTARISASTSSVENASGLRGIYLYSPTDLNVRASQNLDGISTVNGIVRLEVAAGFKLTYGNIVAGGDRDLIIIADDIELAGAYSNTRVTTVSVLQDVVRTRYVYKQVPTLTNYYFFVMWTYPYRVVAESYTVQEYVSVTTSVTSNIAAGTGSLIGTGNLVILNQSNLQNIELGKVAESGAANTLFLTKAIVDTWANGFATLLIGRDRQDSAAKTGTVKVYNYAYQDKLLVRGSQIDMSGVNGGTDPGKLSSTMTLQFDAYDLTSTTGTVEGGVTFLSTGVYEAQSIFVNADKNLTVQGTFTSNATVDGLLQFKAGVNTGNGSVTLDGIFNGSGVGSDLHAESGATSGGISIGTNATFNINDLVSLLAHTGGITQSGTGRITVKNLEVIATAAISIKTRIENLVNAQVLGAGNLDIDEYDSVNLTNASTNNGAITMSVGTGTGAFGTGDLFVHTINAGSQNVTLSVGGEISELASDPVDLGEWHVIGNKLTATAKGDVALLTKLSTLNIQSIPAGAAQGNIIIENTGITNSTLVLESVVAANGLIDISTTHKLQVDSVLTNTVGAGSANNTITLQTIAGGSDATQPGLIRVGTISTQGTSARANVIIDSAGLILQKTTGSPKITARDLFLKAAGNAGSGNDGINLTVDLYRPDTSAMGELSAQTTNFGEVRILSDVNLTARDIETFAGNVYLTVASGTTNPSLAVAKIDAKARDIILSVDGSISDLQGTTVNPLRAGSANNTTAGAKITGDELTVTSGGLTVLDTGVNSLTATVTSGALTVTESDGLNLISTVTTSGDINITVGQYNSTTSTVLTSGNLFIGTLTAGTSGANNATVTAYGGSVETYAPAATPKITANSFTVAAWLGVGQNSSPLHTAVQKLIVSTQQAGNVVIVEDDAILLDSIAVAEGSVYVDAGGSITVDTISTSSFANDSVVDLDTGAGANRDILMETASSKISAHDVILHATGNITAYTSTDLLTASISGGSGPKALTIVEDNTLDVVSAVSTYADMSFTVGGNLNVRKIDATNAYDVSFYVDGKVTKTTPAIGDFNVRADKLTIRSGLNGAAAGGVDLITDVNTLDAVASAPGDLTIKELSGITLEHVQLNNGLVNIESNGNILATLVETLAANAGNSITLTTTSGGNLIYDIINAANGSANATFTIDGLIGKVSGTSLITAALLTFVVNNVGLAALAVDLRSKATNLNGVTTAAGAINLWETDGLIIDSLIAKNGPITIVANGDLTATLIQSQTSNAANTISTTLLGAGSDLTVTTVDAGTSGTVVLDIAGIVGNTGPTSLLTALQLTADIRGGSAGNVFDLRTNVDNLDLETYGTGNVLINEIQSISLNPVIVADGNLTVNAAANITHHVVTVLGHTVNLNAGASILHGTGKLSADVLNADSVTGSTLDTVIRLLNAKVTGTGNFILTERNNLIVSDLMTFNGDITLTVGEYDAGTSSITSPGNLEIDLIRAGALGKDDLTLTVYGNVLDYATGDDKVTRASYTTMDVWGSINLTTDLDTLNGQTFAAGSVTLRESNDLLIEDLLVLNGHVDLIAGGDTTVTNLITDNGYVLFAITGDLDITNLEANNGYFKATVSESLTSETVTVTTGDFIFIVSGDADLDTTTVTTGSIDGTVTGSLTSNILSITTGNLTLDVTGSATLTDTTVDTGEVLITVDDNLDITTFDLTDGSFDATVLGTTNIDTLTILTGNFTLDSGSTTTLGSVTLTDGDIDLLTTGDTTITTISTDNGKIDFDITGDLDVTALTGTNGDFTFTVDGDVDFDTTTITTGSVDGTVSGDLTSNILKITTGNLTLDVTGSATLTDTTVETGEVLLTVDVDLDMTTFDLTDGSFDATVLGTTDIDTLTITTGNFTLDSGSTTTLGSVTLTDGDIDLLTTGDTTITTISTDNGKIDFDITGDLDVTTLTGTNGDFTFTVDGDADFDTTTITTGSVDGTVSGDLTSNILKVTTGDLTLDVTGSATLTDTTVDTGEVLLTIDGDLDITTFDLTDGSFDATVLGATDIDTLTITTGNFTLDSGSTTTLGSVTLTDGDIDLLTTGDTTITTISTDNGKIDFDITGDLTVTTLTGTNGDFTFTVDGDADFDTTTITTGSVDGTVTGDLTSNILKVTTGDLTLDVAGSAILSDTTVVTGEVLITVDDNLDITTFDLTDGSFDATVLGTTDIDTLTITTGNFTLDSGSTTTLGSVTLTDGDIDLLTTGDTTITTISTDNGKIDFDITGDLTVTTLTGTNGYFTFTVDGDADFDTTTITTGSVDGTVTGDLTSNILKVTTGDLTLDVTGSAALTDTTVETGEVLLTIDADLDITTFDLTDGSFDATVLGTTDIDTLTITTGNFTLDSGAATTLGTVTLTEGNVNLTTGGYTTIADMDVQKGYADFDVTASLNVTLLNVKDGDFTFDILGLPAAHHDATFNTVKVVNGSIVGNNSSRDINETDMRAETAGEHIFLTSKRDINLNVLYTDSATGRVELTSVGGIIDQPVGRIISDTLIAEALKGIAMITDTTFLTTDITGTSGDTTVNELNSITVVHGFTASGLFEIVAGDRIEAYASTDLPAVHVEATDLRLITNHGIAEFTNFFNVTVDTIEAEASVDGGIYIHNTKGGELVRILAQDGTINILFDGAMLATDVRTGVDSDDNDIRLTTSSGGMVLNFVAAGQDGGTPGSIAPSFADTFFNSAGNINGTNPFLNIEAVNVTSETITFNAQTGLGDVYAPLVTGRILSASTATGDMNLSNFSSNDFLITGYNTGNGNLSFTQRGGGDLTVDSMESQNGNVKITVGENAVLFLYHSLSFNGDTTLTSDRMEFLGGLGSVDGTKKLIIRPFAPQQHVHIWSPVNGTQYAHPDMLEIGPREIFAINNFDRVFIGNDQTAGNTFMTYFPDNIMFGSPAGTSDLGGILRDMIPNGDEPAADSPDFFAVSGSSYIPLSDFLLPSSTDEEDFVSPDMNVGFDEDNHFGNGSFNEGAFENETDAGGQTAVLKALDHYTAHNEYHVSRGTAMEGAPGRTTYATAAPLMLAASSLGVVAKAASGTRGLIRRLIKRR